MRALCKGKATQIGVVALTLVLVAGCSSASSNAPASAGSNAPASAGSNAPASAGSSVLDPATLQPTSLIASAPDGSKPGTAEDVVLTDAEAAQVRAGNFKVGIAMQGMDLDWCQIQVRSITQQLEKYGVKVISATDGKWNVEKQTADLETMAALKPDGILTIPVDDVAMAPAYKTIAKAGIKLVFLDNTPKGLTYPDQYQSAVGSDNQGNGAISAHALSTRIPQGGTIGMINFGSVLWAGEQRTKGVKDWLKANRPDIVIKETTFSNSSKVSQIAADFITANSDIKGLYGVYDTIGLEALAGLRAMGSNLPVTTIDLGNLLAVELAKGGIVATGAQRVNAQGIAEANAMMKTLIGKSAPRYVMVPSLAVTAANVLEAYEIVFGQPAPTDLVAICKAKEGCG
jgi:ribose transport system substrate-binding protein